MERVFKSKMDLFFDLVDGDGFIIEEDGFEVKKDSVWYWDDYKEDRAGTIQLISDEDEWIEVEHQYLIQNFEEVK